jgi:adenylate kinase
MNILILGPQGSGKGTQAKLLSTKFGLNYFEAGEYLRNLSKTDSKIADYLNKGELIPDDEMFNFAKKYLDEKNLSDNIIFDGYPRSIEQYDLLKDYLKAKGKNIDLAILVNISERETIRRLSARRMNPTTGEIYNLLTNPPPSNIDVATLIHRSDDQPEAIKRRIDRYHETTEKLVAKLQEEKMLVEVNGERPINEISEDLINICQKLS